MTCSYPLFNLTPLLTKEVRYVSKERGKEKVLDKGAKGGDIKGLLKAYDEERISLAEFSRKHEVHPVILYNVMLYKWRRKMIQKKESLSGFSKSRELLVELEKLR